MSAFSRTRTLLTFVLVASTLPSAAGAQSDRSNAPAAAYSCFSPPDSCLRDFARTNDRDYYDLCMLSERICRTYRSSGKLIRPLRDSTILSDCLPVVSVGDLLSLCKSEQDWERASCRQTVIANVPEAGPGRGSRPGTTCRRPPTMSDDAYVRAFVDWSEKHPSKQQLPVAEGITAAIAAILPCRSIKVRRRRLH